LPFNNANGSEITNVIARLQEWLDIAFAIKGICQALPVCDADC
tara:strand:- start:347 stop:475 length:129 start_codon:yes stop_codon:yes gene_type:complete